MRQSSESEILYSINGLRISTGLPTQDKTSETIVQNLLRWFSNLDP